MQHRLLDADTATLHDWRCAGHDTPAREEERNATFEVVVVRRGAFQVEARGRESLLLAGDVWMVPPGESHRFSHPVPGGDDCSIFRLGESSVRALLGRDGDDRAELASRFPRVARTLAGSDFLAHRLAYDAARYRGDALEAEEWASRFLAGVVPSAGASLADEGRAPSRRALQLTASVQEWLLAHYRAPIGLGQLASAVGSSPFHLARVVGRVTGMSIHQHVIRLRLRDALERVLATRDGLSAIGLDAGFSSHSHFTAAFRREFGLTPLAVRRASTAGLAALRAAARG